MNTDGVNLDYFAAIVTAIDVTARPGLRAPELPPIPACCLPMEAGVPSVQRPQAPRISTPEQLQEALEQSRLIFSPFQANLAPAVPDTRSRFDLQSFDWRIEQVGDRANFAGCLSGEGEWQRVELPHYGPPLGRVATYYRVVFDLPVELIAREVVMLRFRGVDYKCQVYLNGICVGQHEGFFEEFEFDCTGVARRSQNTLLVRVENDFTMLGSQLDGDAINGDKIYAATGLGYDDPEHGWHHCPAAMGIYNDVFFEGRSQLAVTDIWVRPLPKEEAAEIRFEVTNFGGSGNEDARFFISVFGQNFSATIHQEIEHRPVSHTERGFGDLDGDHAAKLPCRLGHGVNFLSVRLPIAEPLLWEPDAPWLYQAQVQVTTKASGVLDVATCQFGMRTFEQDETVEPRGRFLLNGKEIRLRGANTMGHLERCIMKGDFDQLRDDILLAKLTHMNFLRLTQRPVHREVYEWCDRLGLMLQTDMPMFASVRRNQMLEIVMQTSCMERHVRAHPSSILVSFINEPRPAAASKPHRFMTRPELERMFLLCAEAVRQENPDRVVKCVDGDYDPPSLFGMPDNHCYCGWYIGHGVDLGTLHHGSWLPVKPGWYFGCGEFGAEGLDSYQVMQQHYPETWLPGSRDATWSPAVIAQSQSWKYHFLWYDTPRTVHEWIEASQKHQEWIVRLMTEAFRRKEGMNTFAIHLFIDAWPAGWMKTIMDVDRTPKRAWFAYHDALKPLAVNLRSDRTQVWAGETVSVEVWVCNDLVERQEGATLRYELSLDERVFAHGESIADIASCAPKVQGVINVIVPEVEKRGRLVCAVTLIGTNGEPLHDHELALLAFPRPSLVETPVRFFRPNEETLQLIHKLGLNVSDSASTIVLSSYEEYQSERSVIDHAVRNGSTVVFLKLPCGNFDVGGTALEVRKAGMGPRHFVSAHTGHPIVSDFEPGDFRFWHSDRLGYVKPILLTVLEGGDWTPILQSGDGGWLRPWGYTPAAVERRDGMGKWRVCQIELADTVATTPTAALFARRLLELP